ncbi:molybdenum cofactor guanylyltransferase [Arthrobacter castelli]|uniref:molybdenum cofactor guanylyltransferase n=1 Tax=Arthrobacter castelli TaxID=271431 RepID=UPI0003F9D52D|nr:NTP transferase domain-containing protein [Arthrobacter castelli]
MPPEPEPVRFDAVVLAGGRSSRLGGVDKASLEFDGSTLLQRTLQAVSGAGQTVVVGPAPGAGLPASVLQAREDPPYAGPAAAIAAGLAALRTHAGRAEYTAVLACDMPYVGSTVQRLLDVAASLRQDGAPASALMAQDGSDKLQPLAALYETRALDGAVRERGAHSQLAGMSVFRLVASLQVVPVPVSAPATQDIDTWEDARTFGIRGPG